MSLAMSDLNKTEANGIHPTSRELDTLIAEEDKNKAEVTKYSFTKDVESADFDPFSERKLDNPTSNMDTLAHLLKASLGTGILSMPKAFQYTGLVNGIFLTILVAVVCTHCAYILIKCAHVLYKKSKKTSMTFAEVAEAAFIHGPRWGQRWAYGVRIFVVSSLFLTYFGTSSIYTIIIVESVSDVVQFYHGVDKSLNTTRLYLLILMPLIIFLVWIRNLKYLAPVSMIANIFMALSLGITFYYIVGTGSLTFESKSLWTDPSLWPPFFSISIFAMEAIGVVMPLENAMKTPRSMLGVFGVLNKGMTGVTIVYIILGFLGYMRYGDELNYVITQNLEPSAIPAQIVKVAIAIAVYCTFGLQFFVCVDLMWNSIKDKFTKRPNLADYVMRTILASSCVSLAIAVPEIRPLMGVMGAFCFSILGLIFPAVIEIITYWDIGFGRGYWLIWKNILVSIFGLFALVFGTMDAVQAAIKVFTKA